MMAFEEWIEKQQYKIKELSHSKQAEAEFRAMLSEAYRTGIEERPKVRFKDRPHRSIYNR